MNDNGVSVLGTLPPQTHQRDIVLGFATVNVRGQCRGELPDHITRAPTRGETGANSIESKLLSAVDAARFEETIGIKQRRVALGK